MHDNDRHHDSHGVPYTMDINFDEVIKALREVGYRGDMTLEADAYVPSFGEDLIERSLANMYLSAKRLRDAFIGGEK
jgi:sugar phosphate isomerase/epimerase